MQGKDDSTQQEQWDRTYAGAQDFFGRLPSELAVSALTTLREQGSKPSWSWAAARVGIPGSSPTTAWR